MKKVIVAIVLILQGYVIQAQISDSLKVIETNQQIDNLVVQADTASLSKLYRNDFVFNHGSGRVDSKSSWLLSAVKGSFISRNHDSVKVELHNFLAIVRGKLNIQKKNKDKVDNYYLWYIRVYTKQEKNWLLISHTTYFEKHL
jgi:hypothetical protein